MTLFEKVSKSPEALAEFVQTVSDRCVDGSRESCKCCPLYVEDGACTTKEIIEILNKDVEEKPTVKLIEVDLNNVDSVLNALYSIGEVLYPNGSPELTDLRKMRAERKNDTGRT